MKGKSKGKDEMTSTSFIFLARRVARSQGGQEACHLRIEGISLDESHLPHRSVFSIPSSRINHVLSTNNTTPPANARPITPPLRSRHPRIHRILLLPPQQETRRYPFGTREGAEADGESVGACCQEGRGD